MERNPSSSRKVLNSNIKGESIRLPSREGKTNDKDKEIKLTSTQDNFFRKSTKSFNSMMKNDYGIVKSDLFQLQEMINENSYFIKMYKLSSKSPSFSKKLSEIEEGKDIKSLIDKIGDDSLNIDRTAKLYNSTSSTELIQRLSLDVNYDELMLRKLNEYFLLLHLKISGDDNLYQETHSKFFTIKLVIDKLLEKYYEANNNAENSYSTYKNADTANDEAAKLIEIKSLNDLFQFSNNSNNEGIRNVARIISDFLDKLYSNYADVLNKYSNKTHKSTQHNFLLENFLTQKLLIEKILAENKNEKSNRHKMDKEESNSAYEEIIKNLKLEIEELSLSKANSKAQVSSSSNITEEDKIKYEEIINNLEIELNKLKKEYSSNKVNLNNTFTNDSNKTLSKIIEESNIALNKMRFEDDGIKNKLYDEIKELSTKSDELKANYDYLELENKELNKKVGFLSKSIKKDADFESYEELMQEQFDNMKKSFLEKIEKLNDEMNKIKIESRRKVNNIQEDLTKVTHVKDLFLRQISELQKQLETA